MKTTSYFSDAKQYIPGGVNSPVRAFKGLGIDPVFIDRGAGKHLYSVEGKEYLDFCLSWGALILGHAHPVIIDAVEKTLRKGTSFGAPTLLETQLAKTLCSIFSSIDKVRFVNSGTEAVMTALRLARAFTNRTKILKFDGCYHGHTDAMLVSAGSGVAGLPASSSSGVSPVVASETLSIPFNDKELFKNVIAQNANSLAAVIIEPVPANMGLIIPQEGYLELIRELTFTHGIVLIFDEVITGLRIGLAGAQGRFGITPDLTTLGKIIGGGFPCAAVGGKDDIMSMLAPQGSVYQAGTLSGNPVAMAAGIATLRFLKNNQDLYTRLEDAVVEFAKRWKQKSDLTINSIGSMFTIFNTNKPVVNFADAQLQNFELFKRRFLAYLDIGVYMPPSMYEAAFVSVEHASEDLTLLLID